MKESQNGISEKIRGLFSESFVLEGCLKESIEEFLIPSRQCFFREILGDFFRGNSRAIPEEIHGKISEAIHAISLQRIHGIFLGGIRGRFSGSNL